MALAFKGEFLEDFIYLFIVFLLLKVIHVSLCSAFHVFVKKNQFLHVCFVHDSHENKSRYLDFGW